MAVLFGVRDEEFRIIRPQRRILSGNIDKPYLPIACLALRGADFNKGRVAHCLWGPIPR